MKDDEAQYMTVYLDAMPNLPRNDQTREEIQQMLRGRFEHGLAGAVERMWQLPAIILHKPDGGYLELLLEARTLFCEGHFYSCVAMCGIVGERLVKDVLRASVMLEKDGKIARPKDDAFDPFEHVEVRGIIDFLKKGELLSEAAAKAAKDLVELRNQYAHARGKNPSDDAIKAIKYLHLLVEGTVSVFKDFEIKDGVFVRKSQSA
jgi:hypothetical protein